MCTMRAAFNNAAFTASPSIAAVAHTSYRQGRNSSTSRLRTAPVAQHSSQPDRLANLNELTERISDLLQVRSVNKSCTRYGAEPVSERHAHLEASMHVVIVFGKRLIRDQLSVEYAKRIVTLVKQLAAGTLDPHMIVFTGARAPGGGCVSEAAAGYAFFRSVCEEAGMNVDKYSFFLEEKSTSTMENIRNVIASLRRHANDSDKRSISRCHFTLVSSDYHIFRLQEVHRLNSMQSALYPMQLFSATWSFIFAAYPFCVSRDPATAFLGRAIVLANDLSIVLVNLTAATTKRQFMARENLYRLHETFAKMRDMYRVIDSRHSATGGFRTDMRRYAETLELAIHRVRDVQTMLAPLSEEGVSVSHEDLELSQRLLMSAVRDIRESMDPDRVLSTSDRVAVMQDMQSYVKKNKPRGDGHNFSEGNGAHPDGVPDGPRIDCGREEREKHMQNILDVLSSGSAADSELAGHNKVTFTGNGKKIARDGPNVVVLDAMASVTPTGNSAVDPKPSRTRRSATATRTPAAIASARVSRSRASAPHQAAATTRKRRTSAITQKAKSPSGQAATKRKTPAPKSS